VEQIEEKKKAYQREKQTEQQFIQKENEKRKAEQQLRYEIENKKEAIERSEEAEQNYQLEIERRRKVEMEKDMISLENDQLKKEIERIKQLYKDEVEQRRNFESRYLNEVEAKERIIKDADERIEKETNQRQLIEKKNRQLKEEKEDSIKRADLAENTITQIQQQLIQTQNESKAKTEQYENERKRSEREIIKAKEEEKRRKEAEIEKGKIQLENFILKRENENNKYEIVLLKEKFGEEMVDEEVTVIENEKKKKEDEIKQLKEENENIIKQKEQEIIKMKDLFENERKKKEEELNKLKEQIEKERQEKEKGKSEIIQLNKIIEQISVPIIPTLIIPSQNYGKVNGLTFIKSQNGFISVLVDPIITSGVVRFEVIVKEHENNYFSFGLAESAVDFKSGERANDQGYKENTVRYDSDSELFHICSRSRINSTFKCGQRIAMEADMNSTPRRLTFFIDNVEQPLSVVGIPNSIRFWVSLFSTGSSFTITKFEKVASSMARGVSGSSAIEWGEK
ncbi:MAG: hypothetical protein EZS28_027037, partial [Streblomastix strix]